MGLVNGRAKMVTLGANDETVRTTAPVVEYVSTKWRLVPSAVTSKPKLPSLKELNAKLAATRAARFKDAEANCLRLTGRPRL